MRVACSLQTPRHVSLRNAVCRERLSCLTTSVPSGLSLRGPRHGFPERPGRAFSRDAKDDSSTGTPDNPTCFPSTSSVPCLHRGRRGRPTTGARVWRRYGRPCSAIPTRRSLRRVHLRARRCATLHGPRVRARPWHEQIPASPQPLIRIPPLLDACPRDGREQTGQPLMTLPLNHWRPTTSRPGCLAGTVHAQRPRLSKQYHLLAS